MKEKFFNYLRCFIDVIFFILLTFVYCYGLYLLGFTEWIELEPNDFYSKFFIGVLGIWLIYHISYVISIIWHELGHLFFGIRAKLSFMSFKFLSFNISKKNDKLVFKRKKGFSDIKGACYMLFEEDKVYDKKDIILYYMGGLIFNLIFSLVSLILLLFNDNLYLEIILMFFMIENIYMALYNSVPSTLKSGATTDMLKIIYGLKDPQYIKVLGKLSQIQNLLDNGIEYKDMDEELFYKPKKFIYPSDVLMAHFYIAYLTSKEKYKEVITYSKKVLVDAKDLLSKNDINLVKIQLINSLFSDTKYFEMIKEYWDDDFDKYIQMMGNMAPQYLYINYVYLLKVEKNEEKAKDILNKFHMMENKYPDKVLVEEIKKKIDEVNKDDD